MHSFDDKQSKAPAKALFGVIEQNAVTKQDLKAAGEAQLPDVSCTVIGFLIHFLH